MKKVIISLFSLGVFTLIFVASKEQPDILPNCAILVAVTFRALDKSY